MRRTEDHFAPDPRVQEALAAIDATLAGEAVQPEHAEMAELSLILAEQRPVPRPEFAAALDTRAQRRFALTAPAPGSRRRHRRRWLYAPGAMVGAAAAVAVVIALDGGGLGAGAGAPPPVRKAVPSAAAGHSAPATTGPRPSTTGSRSGLPPASSRDMSTSHSAESGGASSASAGSVGSTTASAPASASSGSGSAGVASAPPAPHTGGRQAVQSAQLSLTTPPSRVDDVAQQVFDVTGAQRGVVQSSTVTAAGNSSGYAEFQLTVPSTNLQATMSALSRLHGATVASRTDGSQDITGEVGGAGRRLAEARALRSSLLRQLASATGQTQIASLKAQLRDVDAAIARDAARLVALRRQVDNSQISVTVNATAAPGNPSSSGGSGGFTLSTALHDAARVLVVAAGVAVIALAVLVPLSLLGAIGVWAGLALRRRRREQALDLV